MRKQTVPQTVPRLSMDEMQQMLSAERKKVRLLYNIRNAFFTLMAFASVAILAATLWVPTLKIYGSSMEPTLYEGQVVICLKNATFQTGDIVAFRFNNTTLIKRVIAGPGSWVDISEDGTVTVDGEYIDEPYLVEKSLGECDIELPYQVPADKYFVMGDHRATSVDSRSTSIGCIATEDILGKLIFRVLPATEFGFIE